MRLSLDSCRVIPMEEEEATGLEERTAPRAIKKRFVPLTDGFSLQVKAFTPTNEIKFVLMKLVDGDGWTPIIWIAVPAEQGPALLKALQEVL